MIIITIKYIGRILWRDNTLDSHALPATDSSTYLVCDATYFVHIQLRLGPMTPVNTYQR